MRTAAIRFIARPPVVGALNCSSLGGAVLRRSHKTEEVLCVPWLHRCNALWMILSCFIVFGADYRLFSQFGYIFYVLSMPIESTKELCAYGRFLNGKRS